MSRGATHMAYLRDMSDNAYFAKSRAPTYSTPKANYASSTYSTSTTSTEKPLNPYASSTKKSSNPWKRTKAYLAQHHETIDQAYERKARENAAAGKKPERLPIGLGKGLGPFNDERLNRF
jgi:hypothetical protein